jgi:hypothetical protein
MQPSGFIPSRRCVCVYTHIHRLRVFEDTVLRKMFGLMRDEVTVERRRQHNEELHDLYSSPNIIPLMKS